MRSLSAVARPQRALRHSPACTSMTSRPRPRAAPRMSPRFSEALLSCVAMPWDDLLDPLDRNEIDAPVHRDTEDEVLGTSDAGSAVDPTPLRAERLEQSPPRRRIESQDAHGRLLLLMLRAITVNRDPSI